MGIDLFPILLLVIFIIGIKPVREKGKINENYLSVDTGNSLRGLCAIVVVLHHVAQSTEMGLLFRIFSCVGYLAVAMFFFFSGFGLQKSYITSENYKKHFLRRRLSKVLIPYVVVTMLFWMMYALEGNFYSLKEIVGSILNGDPIVTFSWYIISICYFYITYWLLMRICKKNYNLMLICTCIWYAIYVIVCRQLGYDTWWYNTTHVLIFGMFYATYEHEIVQKIKAYYHIITPIVISGFCLAFITNIKFNIEFGGVGLTSMILTMLASVLFVLSVVLVSAKIKIGNPIMNFLGKISMEIYLVQGLFMHGLRSGIIYIENDFLWALMVVLGSIILASILHKIFSLGKKPVKASKVM